MPDSLPNRPNNTPELPVKSPDAERLNADKSAVMAAADTVDPRINNDALPLADTDDKSKNENDIVQGSAIHEALLKGLQMALTLNRVNKDNIPTVSEHCKFTYDKDSSGPFIKVEYTVEQGGNKGQAINTTMQIAHLEDRALVFNLPFNNDEYFTPAQRDEMLNRNLYSDYKVLTDERIVQR